MRVTRQIAFGAMLAATAVGVLSAQSTQPSQPFRSGVELVMVDVGVIDRQGQPLRGLTAGDFTVTVGGVPRRVVSAEFVDTMADAADRAAHPDVVPVSTNEGGGVGHLFMFVIDQNTLDASSGRYVANAASRLLAHLTPSDRSGFAVLPVGQRINFTWAHDRVQQALAQVSGTGLRATGWEYGTLADARDIATRNPNALRTVLERQCGTSTFGSASSSTAAASPTGGTGTGGGGATTGGSSGSTPAGGGSSAAGGGGRSSSFEAEACARSIQMQAESTWQEIQSTSLTSLGALRQLLQSLAPIPGDKTLILLSGGWPLDEHEELTTISNLAADAAAARATIFSIFVQRSSVAVDRRDFTFMSARDQYMQSGPLEFAASMTGGGFYRGDVGAEGVFDRLAREMSGYYRLGIQREPGDGEGKSRHLKVQVARNGTTVRARDMFDVRTYEDRDWAARLGSALESPLPATGVGLRMTSYVGADPQDRSHVKLVLTGEASRLQPGDVSYRVLLRDLGGGRIATAEQRLGEADADGGLPFTAELSVPQGTYIARMAVIDSAGRAGSVDHRVDARPTTLGTVTATGPLLVRVPAGGDAPARLALDTVRQGDRLALEIAIDEGSGSGTTVEFSIAPDAGGPTLLRTPAMVGAGPREGTMLAQAVADMRLLPAGSYVARATVSSGAKPLGELRRAFTVVGASPARLAAGGAASVERRDTGSTLASTIGIVPAFAPEQLLAPAVRGPFLDRLAARADAASPGLRGLIDRARGDDIADLAAGPDVPAGSAAAAFVSGLSLLAQRKLDPAANAFRAALRAAPDFYPSMIYLGACYAAGGRDKEAAAAWRTALIREADLPWLHGLLTNALLREGTNDQALDTIAAARARWPDDRTLDPTFTIAALRAGDYATGLTALDGLIDAHTDTEPALTLGLLVLHEAFTSGTPIESVDGDRARMQRLAAAYRARGGSSQALVDLWVSSVLKK